MSDHITRQEFDIRKQEVDGHIARLHKIVDRLHRGQKETTIRVDALTERIEGLPSTIEASVQSQLDKQTEQILEHVDDKQQAVLGFVTDKLVETARQWPAPAIIAVTAVLALIVAVVAIAIARAVGWS